MNKSQKIVISIISVTLVLLILLGLTYAYFLTQIKGNTNEKSISVTTADLKLEYGDGNGFVTLSNVVPNTTITPLITKTFTVSNKGNVTVDYGVFLEEVINTFERVEDLDLKVECTSSINNKACNGYDDKMLINNDMLFSNSIDEEEIQTFTLTLDYKDNGLDQSVDMNKNVSAKVQIYGLNDTVDLSGEVTDANPGDYIIVSSTPKKSYLKDNKYKVVGLLPEDHTISVFNNDGTLKYTKNITIQQGKEESITDNIITITKNTSLVNINISESEADIEEIINNPYDIGTLSYNILNNAQLNKNGTMYRKTPLTKVAEQVSLENESVLSVADDDLGTSYYFRGNVENNYVNFAGMCWRIVRIEGDGSIKLLLEEKRITCTPGIAYGDWAIPTEVGGNTYNGNYGYIGHEAQSLTALDGTKNTYQMYIMSYLDGANSNSMATAFKNFQGNNDKINGTLTRKIYDNYNQANISDYLKADNWCLGDKVFSKGGTSPYYTFTELTEEGMLDKKIKGENLYYDTSLRLSDNNVSGYNPTFKCNGTSLNKFNDSEFMYVATITVDEMVFAGAIFYPNKTESNFYMINNYQKANQRIFWTLSPMFFRTAGGEQYDFIAAVYYNGGEYNYSPDDARQKFRPAIVLKPNIKISGGVGTITNPYIIK